MTSFRLEIKASGIALLMFDLPGEKVNKISVSVGEALEKILKTLEKDSRIKGLILISGKPDIFIAGADINEILAIKTKEEGTQKSLEAQRLPNLIESLPFPTVAAIHGACLGGGLELVLPFTYRIVTDSPKTVLGLPEVSLGILPGMGGCNRLPPLVGLQPALSMILAGGRWPAKKCLKTGLVDEMVPREILLDRAIEVLEKNMWSHKKPRKVTLFEKLLEGNRLGRNFIRKKAQENILEKTSGHYPAPLKALEVIYDCLDRGLTDGLKIEADGFGVLAETEVSKNLIRLFFLSEALKKKSGVLNADIKPREIKKAAVLGAGTMGGGIAQLFGYRDISVRLKDIQPAAVGKGLAYARALFQKMVDRKKMTPRELEKKMALIGPTTHYTGFKQVDVVVEAVIEDATIKQKVFSECESHLSSEAILASNTSSISISTIASQCQKKDRVIGMHFFNPVHKMPLVEVVVDPITSPQTIATVVALSKQLGKVPIVVKNSPGFLVNRILMPYMNEAAHLLEEGISMTAIDDMMTDFGMPMGPFTLLDTVGIDVAHKVSKILHTAFGDRMKPSPLLERVVEAGYYGKKNKKGFYHYKKREQQENMSIYTLIGVRPKTVEMVSDEWQNRIVYQMINESIRCLEEEVVGNVEELDLALIYGIGFPPFRGGLLWYADQLSPTKIMSELDILARRYGERFQVPQYLKALVETGGKFYEN